MKRTPKELFQEVIIHNANSPLIWSKIFGSVASLTYPHIGGADVADIESSEPLVTTIGQIAREAIGSVKPNLRPTMITLFSDVAYIDNPSQKGVYVAHLSLDWADSDEKYAFIAMSMIEGKLEIAVNAYDSEIGQAIFNVFSKSFKKQEA